MASFLRSLTRKHCSIPALIICCVGIYVYFNHYFTYVGVPGAHPDYPLGWWGWFDQGFYLKASKNFLSGAIAASDQLYPPLYPMLGAIFLPVSEMHGYAALNLALFVTYLWVCMRLLTRHLGGWLAALTIIIGIFWYHIISLQWIIPWTSSLAAVFQILSLFLFQRFLEHRHDPDWNTGSHLRNAALFALCVGLLGPTRPLDLIIFSLLLLSYACIVLLDGLSSSGRTNGRSAVMILGVGTVCSAIPTMAYLAFNTLLFGAPLEGYFALAQGSGGSTLLDTFDRLFSHVVNANAFYAEPSADWRTSLPLFLVSLCFVPFALLWGPLLFRMVAACVLLHIGFVYSYADAVPTGQFRYYNIHYFKWMFPIIPFFMIYALMHLLQSRGAQRNVAGVAIVIAACIGLVSISLSPSYTVHFPDRVSIDSDGHIVAEFAEPINADFFDIRGPSPDFGHFEQRVERITLDERAPLEPFSEARITPRPGGVRFLMVDPQKISKAVLNPVGLSLKEELQNPQILAAKVSLGFKAPWRQADQLPMWPPKSLVLGKRYEAGGSFNASAFLTRGWSNLEAWGRWMDGPEAELSFALPENNNSEFWLEIEGNAFYSASVLTEVNIDVIHGNDTLATLQWKDSGGTEQFLIPLPTRGAHEDNMVQLSLRARSTASPQSAGLSQDARELSFGLIGFTLVTQPD